MSCFRCIDRSPIGKIMEAWLREQVVNAPSIVDNDALADYLYSRYKSRLLDKSKTPYGSLEWKLHEAIIDEVPWLDLAQKIIEERE